MNLVLIVTLKDSYYGFRKILARNKRSKTN